MMCRIFGRDSPGKHSNASRIRRAILVDLELTWQYPLREFCPKQKICLRKSSSPFTIYILYIYISLQKQVGCFNHRVVTLVADKLERL